MHDLIATMNIMARASRMAANRVASDFNAHVTANMLDGTQVPYTQSSIEIVTPTDTASKAILAETLSTHYPDIPFVGKECGGSYDHDRFFLADPLAGSKNFIALRDYFAVCATYIEGGQVKAAVIADPCRGTLIKAAAGHGAYFEDTRGSDHKLGLLSRNTSDNLKDMLLEFEISIDHGCDLSPYKPLLNATSGFRKSGSTALDLYHLALGRNMGLIADRLAPHDLAAGLLIVHEVGGIITDLKTTNMSCKATYRTTHIMAARPSLHGPMYKKLKWG